MKDNYIRKAVIVNVIDSDTFDAEVDLGFHTVITERFRLMNVSGFETRRRKGITEEEIMLGLAGKAHAESLVLGKEVQIKSIKRDGFRRWLGEIYVMKDGQLICLAEDLVKQGLATHH